MGDAPPPPPPRFDDAGLNPLLKAATMTQAGTGVTRSLAEAPPVVPSRRGKVPLEKGHSQVDWMRRAAAHKPPPPRDVTPAEVAAHPDSWTVLRGRVYDVRGYAPFHPGGEAVLKPAYGKDATKLFDATHAWVNAHALLASCYVGRLVGEGGGGGK